jgi:hypothetical protein
LSSASSIVFATISAFTVANASPPHASISLRGRGLQLGGLVDGLLFGGVGQSKDS